MSSNQIILFRIWRSWFFEMEVVLIRAFSALCNLQILCNTSSEDVSCRAVGSTISRALEGLRVKTHKKFINSEKRRPTVQCIRNSKFQTCGTHKKISAVNSKPILVSQVHSSSQAETEWVLIPAWANIKPRKIYINGWGYKKYSIESKILRQTLRNLDFI